MATPPSSASTSSAAAKVAPRKARSRSRWPAACAGSIAATVFITDGNLSRLPFPGGGGRSRAAPSRSARRGALDLVLPGIPHLFDEALGQRHVIQLGCHARTVRESPVKEFDRGCRGGRIRWVGVYQDEARSSDGPALVARLIGKNQMKPGCVCPVGIRRRRLEGCRLGKNLLTRGVGQRRVRHLVL